MLDRRVAPTAFPVEKVLFPTPAQYTLANGIEVWVVSAGEQEVFKFELSAKAGAIHSPVAGLAGMTASLMKRGTAVRSAQEIHQAFDFFGAFWDIQASLDHGTFTVYGLTKHFHSLIPLVGEILQEATFPAEEVEKEIEIERQKTKLNWEKTSYAASQKFRAQVFPNDPYGRFTVAEDFDKLDRAALVQQYSTTWASQKPVIFLSGKISEEQIAYLDQTLGQIKYTSSELSIPPVSFASNPVKIREEKEGSVQCSIRFGLPAISRTHPDYFKFSLMNTVLGGYFGSRLQKNIREDKGFTYGISSSLAPYPRGGYWVVGTDVNGENVDATLAEIKKEITILQTELIPQDELEIVQNYLMGSFTGELTQAFDIAEKVRVIQLNGLAPDFYDQFQDQILEIQAQDIRDMAAKYLNLDLMHEVIVG
ncbi:M16 family metallopeptidase [Aquirufa antheringensis]|uniref:M16 family metallopeptidase n=1 Tax=Aquirufa antheringensis TaxID=2516559 RepID=UPI001F9C60C5|nr:pitrilysin family protein [Aquirufa antheringensis]MCE4217799.1 insulinase family protein [Pseudarcicella sp. GAP-15]USQ03776.1 insulinase family protein [Aquirufa antheringensis]